MSDLSRTIEALLFLSPQPVSAADLAMATEATEGQVAEAIELLREDLAEGKRGVVLREVSGGFALASDPGSEEAARRLRALRDALAGRNSIDFDDQFGNEDRLTQAVTLFALLELYRKGEVTWEQDRPLGPIRVRRLQPGTVGGRPAEVAGR